MKGLADIEFMLSVVVFLTTITFVTFIITSNIPLFHRESINEDIRAKAYQISELMLFDVGASTSGSPDWTSGDVGRIGLSGGGSYNISLAKINEFGILCSGSYANTRSLLGLDYTNDVYIEISSFDGTILASCKPAVSTTIRPKFQISRFSVLSDNRIIKVIVGVS